MICARCGDKTDAASWLDYKTDEQVMVALCVTRTSVFGSVEQAKHTLCPECLRLALDPEPQGCCCGALG